MDFVIDKFTFHLTGPNLRKTRSGESLFWNVRVEGSNSEHLATEGINFPYIEGDKNPGSSFVSRLYNFISSSWVDTNNGEIQEKVLQAQEDYEKTHEQPSQTGET